MTDVLVVDDEEDLRELVSDLLADHGYVVQTASNGLVALDWMRIQATPPKIILLDVMMPAMDGPTFRKELLASSKWQHIPVVLMTASVHDEAAIQAMQVSHLLKKPLRFDAILLAVREFILKTMPPPVEATA